MKREHLCRGKRFVNAESFIDKEDWVYGYYYYSKITTDHNIINDEDEIIEVIPETVGQFTGLTDKNGKEIFEGDVLKVELPLGGFWGNIKRTEKGQVRYEPERGSYIVEWEYSKNQHHEIIDCDITFTSEVIGNIHDNPNLL